MRWITALFLLASVASAGRIDLFEYNRRAAKLGPRNARSHFVLALWCERKQLRTRAWKHHALVLAIEPKHRASNRAVQRLRPNPKLLVREALRGPRKRVRDGALIALQRTTRPARWFLPTLRSRSATLRSRAIRALGALGDEHAVAPLIRHLSIAGGNTTSGVMSSGGQTSYVQDFDVEVA
jgi:hypothetical protein